MTEQQIQTKIINTLTSAGWYVNKLINTSKKGIPDLIAHKDGRTVYIEVKIPGQKPRELQVFRMNEIEQYKIKCVVCDDETKILNLLQ